MRIPDEVIMEIKYKNPIEEVISPYVNLKRAGRNLNGLCPFHNEKTPSFTVYTDTGSFYCFGCGAGGDAFGFIRRIENLDYIEAVKKLADKAGVNILVGDYDDSYFKIESIKELQEGDLVYFNTNRSDKDLSDHAGIYIGDNQFIHASSSKRKVIISDLSEGYYNERFSRGRRIVEEGFYESHQTTNQRK